VLLTGYGKKRIGGCADVVRVRAEVSVSARIKVRDRIRINNRVMGRVKLIY